MHDGVVVSAVYIYTLLYIPIHVLYFLSTRCVMCAGVGEVACEVGELRALGRHAATE